MHRQDGKTRVSPASSGLLGMIAWLCLAVTAFAQGPSPVAPRPTAEDDRIIRPTVIVRKGSSQGSGTIIASVPGETLVLTAAHVAQSDAASPMVVELHRFNLGVEHALPRGGWPLSLPAELAAADPAADLAVLRIRGRPDLPFVARLARVGDEPAPGSLVSSVGVDGGNHLSSWSTRLNRTVWFIMDPRSEVGDAEDGAVEIGGRAGTRVRGRPRSSRPVDDVTGPERPFLITGRAPEHGRSGGGLFARGGMLVGVCVGRIELGQGRGNGVFSSGESVRRLLRENELDALVARSEALRTRPVVTPTRAPVSPPRAGGRR